MKSKLKYYPGDVHPTKLPNIKKLSRLMRKDRKKWMATPNPLLKDLK